MPDIDAVRGWRGRTMLDRDGDRIGTIEDIYADDRTGQPEWALVNTGLFGTRSTFVPIGQAAERDGDVQVPYEKGWSRTPQASRPTSTCRRPRSSSCGATTAWTTVSATSPPAAPPKPGRTWATTVRRPAATTP
jgi:PRC-barrel domain